MKDVTGVVVVVEEAAAGGGGSPCQILFRGLWICAAEASTQQSLIHAEAQTTGLISPPDLWKLHFFPSFLGKRGRRGPKLFISSEAQRRQRGGGGGGGRQGAAMEPE